MRYSADGNWRITEGNDPAPFGPEPPAMCLRCGISIEAWDGRAINVHDAFHVRIGDTRAAESRDA